MGDPPQLAAKGVERDFIDEDKAGGGEEEEEQFPDLGEVAAEVTLNSVVGLSNPKTMKLLGVIEGKEVVVMIDPGATHNFISIKTIEELNIPVRESGNFGVSLGNGESVRGTGVCERVVLALNEELVIKENLLTLNLGNSDLILGIEWLEKLGTISSNWKTQTMRFQLDGRAITLHYRGIRPWPELESR